MSDIFRKEYRAMSARESLTVIDVKEAASHLLAALNGCVPSRELSLAVTKLQECVFWAISGITG